MLYFPPPSDEDCSPQDEPGISTSTTADRRHSAREPVEGKAEQNNVGQRGPHAAGLAQERQILALKDEVESQRALIVNMGSELQEVKLRLKQKTDAYDLLKRQYDAKCKSPGQRTIETLAEAKLSSQADELSEEEITRAIRSFNSQILSIAKACSDPDNLKKRFPGPNKRAVLNKEMRLNLEKIIGAKLLLFLEGCSFEEHRLFVQFSLQAVMCYFMSSCFEVFPFSPMTNSGTFARNLFLSYRAMHAEEPQGLSSIWRSLTSKYMKVAGSTGDIAHEHLRDGTLQYFARILVVAGASDDMDDLMQYCNASISSSVSTLWASALEFNRSLKERVLSSDYSLVSLRPNPILEFNELTRDPDAAVIAKVLGRNVLCTIEVGVLRETSMSGPGALKGRVERKCILPPTIVFEWELDRKVKT